MKNALLTPCLPPAGNARKNPKEIMDKIRKYFETIGFSGGGLEKIVDSFVLQKFAKNDFVVESGKVSQYFGFVDSGMFQYYILKDGEELTHYVNIENTWFASLHSFLSGTPSLENVRALTDGAIFLLSKPNLRKLNKEGG
jgi:CRP/FNR family transcriptional regulator, anaerobic regulatory protein